MNSSEVIKKLELLQKQIVEAASGEVDDRPRVLSSLQSELESVLKHIDALQVEGRQKVLPMVKQFSEQLKERIDELREEMHSIRSSAESTKSHANVAKAYSGKIF